MKRFVIILCIAWCALHISGHTHLYSKSVWLHFQENDFEYVFKDSLLSISTHKLNSSYPTGRLEAAIPQIPFFVLINKDDNYFSHSQHLSERIMFGHTKMNIPPSIVPNNLHPSITVSDDNISVASSFRDNVEYTVCHVMDGYKFLSFLVSPFIYDSIQSTVKFADSIKIEIQLEKPSITRNKKQECRYKNEFTAIIKKLVANSEECDSLYPRTDSRLLSNSRNDNSFRYLIITHDSLVNAFAPLLEWKRTKGLSTKIETLSNIYSTYTTGTNRQKIKQYIKDCKQSHDTHYVLLGGDNAIIPFQKCYCKIVNNGVTVAEDNTIPSDLFYSCLDGDLSWNSNGNYRVGEIEDNIDLAPDIFLSRLPIRNTHDISAYINKIIDYEQHPILEAPNMLSCAVQIDTITTSGVSDSQYLSECMYLSDIQPHWEGNYLRFYDTGTDFEGGANYDVTPSHLQEQLSKGYNFVHVNTHGSVYTWLTEDNDFYLRNHANNLHNTGYTLLTTNACLTNSCDNSDIDPCLSESFLRNENSGIIGFVGYTRNSYSMGTLSYELSCVKEIGRFYNCLFSAGEVARSMNVFNEALSQDLAQLFGSYNINRWNYMCLSYMGDPELNLYHRVPSVFPGAEMSVANNNLRFNLTSEIPHSNLAVKDRLTGNLTIHSVEQPYIDVSIPDSCTVFVTHEYDFAPVSFSIIENKVYLQNYLLMNNWNIYAPKVFCGSAVDIHKPEGNVIVEDGATIGITASQGVLLDKGFEVRRGASFRIDNR